MWKRGSSRLGGARGMDISPAQHCATVIVFSRRRASFLTRMRTEMRTFATSPLFKLTLLNDSMESVMSLFIIGY